VVLSALVPVPRTPSTVRSQRQCIFGTSGTLDTSKRVYIPFDLEGISGVNGDHQTSAGQPEYARARKLMAEDANAAIRDGFEGGATEVVVNDSHDGQRGLLPEDLDPRASPPGTAYRSWS
jgi:D-amino peptidase